MMPAITSAWILLLIFQCSELRGYYLYGRDVGASGHTYHRSWTPWSSWSHCSRTCGGGIIMRTRLCRRRTGNWMVEKAGFCPGETTEYRVCNTKDCPKVAVNFRQYQCSLYNNRLVAKHHVKEWIPYEKGENKCELKCQEKDSDKHYSFGKVSDGTECSNRPNSKDICVNGRCLAVGCDGKVGSGARLDVCGECGGRNNTCVYYRNMYLGQPTEPGYQEIAIIPAGSTHLEIRDVSYKNHLALTDSRYQYVINGPGVSSYPGEYHITGTVVNYSRLTENKETISASGPTSQQLHVVALLRDRNPGIYYEYWVPKNKYYYIINDMWNTNRSNILMYENHQKYGERRSPNDRLLERSQYGENMERNAVMKDIVWRSKPWFAEVKEETANPLTYHKYQVDNLRSKKWNGVSIRIVDTSGQNVPLANSYTTAIPSVNKTDCVLCAAGQISGKKKGRNNNGTIGRCQVCKKVKNLAKHFCKSDFVVRGIIINKEKIEGKLRYVLQVVQSFKNSIPMQPREYIWTRGTCICPKLRLDKEYIIMGYSDYSRRENRLLIDRKCYTRRYKRNKSLQLLRVKRNGCANII